jgi:hypothetical protein
VVPLSPRYSPRLLETIRALDDRSLPIAEVNRRVGRVAEELGIFRPSYPHVRRLIQEQRLREDEELARREEIRAILKETANALLAGRVPDPYYVLGRLDDASRRVGGSEPQTPRGGSPAG